MEASNIKAMREAMKQIYDRVNSLDEDCGVDPVEIRDIARAALASPPRNCDVGTADEQHARFDRFCDKYEDCWECPVWRGVDWTSKCSVYWSQMPYEEGGEK